jgi:hypothetical protein
MRRRLVLEYSKLPPKQMELRIILGSREVWVSTEGSNRVKRVALLGRRRINQGKATGRAAVGDGHDQSEHEWA